MLAMMYFVNGVEKGGSLRMWLGGGGGMKFSSEYFNHRMHHVLLPATMRKPFRMVIFQ